jgi:hypothetical protein
MHPNYCTHGHGKQSKTLASRLVNVQNKHQKKVWFEPGSARFRDFEPCPNPELNLWSGSAQPPNLGLNFGLILKSSGLNFGSEPNCGIPTKKE